MSMRIPKWTALAAALSLAPARAAIPQTAHPDWTLASIPLMHKAMGLAFLKNGSLALAVTEEVGGGEVPKANPKHAVFIVTDPASASPKVKEVANNWLQIAGLVAVEDKLYVSDRDGFYEILDLASPGDLKANRRLIVEWPDESRWNTFGFQWHQWVFTPMHKDGWFYGPYSGSIVMGGPSDTKPTTSYSGAFLKWDLTGKLEKFAGGLRSPNGAGINPAGEMFVADNQGSWLPASTFMHMKPDRFYGHSNTTPSKPSQKNWAEDLPYERPTAWLDHGKVRTSPSQPAWIPAGPYRGDWLLGDCNNIGLVRIALDDVEGTYNGSVFWFSHGFGEAAINRLAFGPDGNLYAGTITKAGNWPQGSLSPLYKLTPKAAPAAFDIRAVRSVQGGVELVFTDPVDEATADASAFSVEKWKYTRQEGYGQGKGQEEVVAVAGAALSEDNKRVFLELADLEEDHVIYVKATGVKSSAGKALWNDEAWFTLNRQSAKPFDPAPVAIGPFPPKPSRLKGKVRPRLLPGLGLEIAVDTEGPYIASLKALDGTLKGRLEGWGKAPRLLSAHGTGDGLFILEVKQGGDAWSLPVHLIDIR